MADKPLLNRVQSNNDPELYNEDLDWLFNCYDSECGLRSVGLSGAIEAAFDSSGNKHRGTDETASPVTVNLTGGSQGASGNPNPWATAHHLKAFRRGRQLWRKYAQLPFEIQQGLRRYYEPKQSGSNPVTVKPYGSDRCVMREETFGLPPLDEKLVRYYHMFWNQ